MELALNNNLPENKVHSIVIRIRVIYFVLACFGIIVVLYSASGISSMFGYREGLVSTLDVLIYSSIYFGLRHIRKWVVPLILIHSAFSLYCSLLLILHQADNITMILSKFIAMMLVLFYAYQILFFSKGEARNYFGSQGTIIF
jgi:hypothetical protein